MFLFQFLSLSAQKAESPILGLYSWHIDEKAKDILMVCVCMLSRYSCVRLFANLWTIVCQAPLSMGFSSQEYWSGLPCPPPGDLPDPGIEPTSLMSTRTGRQVLYH